MASHVDPETAARDMSVLKALRRGFGHIDMGVYAEAITAAQAGFGTP